MHRRRQKRDGKKESAGGSGQAGGTAGAMATAVSSGDDLTDFQSQPRSGQRLVSPAGGRGRRRSCSSVRVEFALWSLLLLRCAALATLQPIFIFIFILFLYLHCRTCLLVSLSHCLSVCPLFLSLCLSHSLFVCSINFCRPKQRANGHGNLYEGRGTWWAHRGRRA